MPLTAAKFWNEASRFHALADEATTGGVRTHLLRLAQHFRAIAEGLQPLLASGEKERPTETAAEVRGTSSAAAPALSHAAAKPKRVTAPRPTAVMPGVDPAEDREPQQRVRERAYAIWEREGRPHGRDRERWSRAERELAAKIAAGCSLPEA